MDNIKNNNSRSYLSLIIPMIVKLELNFFVVTLSIRQPPKDQFTILLDSGYLKQ